MDKQNADTISGGVLLIGLGVLFLFDWFWPGILLLIGVVSLVNQWIKGRFASGLTSLLVLGGLTIAFSFNFDWAIVFPVVLIGLGVIGVANALRGRKA